MVIEATVFSLLEEHEWEVIDCGFNYICAWKHGCAMEISPTNMTVKTKLIHPKRGDRTLVRKKLTPGEFIAILENPREHTGKGYFSRKEKHGRQ